MNKWLATALLVVGATVLSATVLREPVAYAAQIVDATIVGPLDSEGNLKVHEQGVADVKLDARGNVVRIQSSSGAPVNVDEVDTPKSEAFSDQGASFNFVGNPERLTVLEYVSAHCLMSHPDEMRGVRIFTGQDDGEYFLPRTALQSHADGTFEGWANGLVRINVLPGHSGSAAIQPFPSGEGAAQCTVSLSGRLEE